MEEAQGQEALDGERLGGVAEEVAERIASEFGALSSTPFRVSSGGSACLAAAEIAEEDAPLVLALAQAGGDAAIPLRIVVPRPLAALLAGLQSGKSLDDIDVSEALDAGALMSLAEVLQVVLASFQQALSPALDGDCLVEDALEVETPASDPTWLDAAFFHRVRFEIAAEGVSTAPLDVLFPSGEGPVESESDDAPESPKRILLLHDQPKSVDVKSLVQAFGCRVEACDLAALRKQGEEAVAVSEAILIPWQIAGVQGIEVVERLADEASQAGTSLVMLHPEPTRPMVISSLQAGATSFLLDAADYTRTGPGATPGNAIEESDMQEQA